MLRIPGRDAPLRNAPIYSALINLIGRLARGMSQIIVVNKPFTMTLGRTSLNMDLLALTLVFLPVRVPVQLFPHAFSDSVDEM